MPRGLISVCLPWQLKQQDVWPAVSCAWLRGCLPLLREEPAHLKSHSLSSVYEEVVGAKLAAHDAAEDVKALQVITQQELIQKMSVAALSFSSAVDQVQHHACVHKHNEILQVSLAPLFQREWQKRPLSLACLQAPIGLVFTEGVKEAFVLFLLSLLTESNCWQSAIKCWLLLSVISMIDARKLYKWTSVIGHLLISWPVDHPFLFAMNCQLRTSPWKKANKSQIISSFIILSLKCEKEVPMYCNKPCRDFGTRTDWFTSSVVWRCVFSCKS